MSLGGLELVLVAMGAIASAIAFAVARRLARGGPPAPPRSPLPRVALGVAALLLLPAPPVGYLLAPAVIDQLAGTSPSGVVIFEPFDLVMARVIAALSIAAWAAVPGASAAAFLVVSRRRSVGTAAAFALATWVGFTLGAAATFPIVASAYDAMSASAGDPSLAVQVDLRSLVSAFARAALGLGFIGGSAAALSVAAASSPRGLRGALIATAALPLIAPLVGALSTPPDVVSQLLVAAVTVALWLLGLGVGAAARRALSGRGDAPPSAAA
ncbi:MAG: hypothetical protein H6719_04130 [Sandaracinaceae bacterium]|nr:hypothetical protein [Sandaracinaceae bacterium]